MVVRACERVEADAHAFEGEVAARLGARGDQVDRMRGALDGKAGGARDLDRHAEAPRDVVRAPGGEDGELRLRARDVGGGVQRAVAAEQHDAATRLVQRRRELLGGRRQARLDARTERAERADGVPEELGATHQPARVRVRDHQELGGERAQPTRPGMGRGWRERCGLDLVKNWCSGHGRNTHTARTAGQWRTPAFARTGSRTPNQRALWGPCAALVTHYGALLRPAIARTLSQVVL